MRTLFDRKFFAEAATLVVAALLCAVVANSLAARERKVRWAAAADLPARASIPVTTSTSTAPIVSSDTIVETTSSGPAPATSAPLLPVTTPPAAATSTVGVPASKNPPVAATATQSATAPKPTAPPAAAAKFPPHPDKPWVEISGDAVEQLHRQGAPFFDARRTDVYLEGHIPRAVNISVWESDVDDKVKGVYEQNLDPEKPIVIYCSGGECEDSHTLAQKLWGIGLNNALVYKDGFPDWVARKQPVNKGPNP